jgi:adenosylcobyric acid synthase
VLPYVTDLGLPEEDGLALKNGSMSQGDGSIRIVVVRLKYIANFTDFDPFFCEPDVHLLYSVNPSDIENADMVILPGSKNTVKDLLLLREGGLDKSILRAYEKGVQITAVCGGYQMMGRKIRDPKRVESIHPEIDGLGLLNIDTVFDETKTTCQVEAEASPGSLFFRHDGEGEEKLKGYEIHMGTSTGDLGQFKVKRLGNPDNSHVLDGSAHKNCWGTYLHGIFENDGFRREVINRLRERKGLAPLAISTSYGRSREEALDRLASIVRKHLDMTHVRRILEL